MMACLNLHLGVVCIFSIVVIGFAANCNDKQVENNDGRCCDLCPPGEYMKESKEEICLDSQKTVCVPCEKGYYSKGYTPNRCVQCSRCEHDYEGNCTPTTNVACKCRPGFLCSNNVCSNCLQQQCSKGEQLKRHGQVDYRYTCEPCPDNTYSDTNDGKCKTLTQCSATGMMIEFAGNKTHNAICQIFVKAGDPTRDPTKVVLSVGFVTIAFTFLIFLIHAYIKNINRKRKDKKCHAANRVMMSPAGSHECSLSKEESGGQSIHQAESSDDDSAALSLKQITVC